ncbi:MAG: bifunctional glutamate N-acetyltransferase/amino-acid acetyltransferase ArgJ [Rhodobacteraceae bacterium]|nr:bifunctional glutamate N-acetyltransferase/amino-acid acetyltransferase ArgJ [Paracoccaceae bacterium]
MVSPLAPKSYPELPQIEGVVLGSVEAGIKYSGRRDLAVIYFERPANVAGVFTQSKCPSAPVEWCRKHLDRGTARCVVINSGNANAFTGHIGQTSVAELTTAIATSSGVPANRVFTASTGVIGEPMKHERIITKLAELNNALNADAIHDAAQAIMTTDTFAKGAGTQVIIDGKPVVIAGFAKGSGMVAPDMATMLVYIFTDAKVDQPDLQSLLSRLTDKTFNCITVDSDTSTSDSLMLCATGASGVDATDNDNFAEALHRVMLNLAHQVVRDGEGATKFVEIRVIGASNDVDAKTHALSIANSPLVKTAVAGEDPNWGRVVMAIGKSGARADRDLISIWFGSVLVADKGWVSPDYIEADAAEHMKGQSLRICVDIGLGNGESTVWTCDFTHGYIEINADYRS